MKTERIKTLIESCDGTPEGIKRTASAILAEDTQIKVGDTVGVVSEDETMGMVGKGKVKSFSDDKAYANVVFDDGRVIPILTNGLYLVR
jgi:hypothetical protein